MGDKKCECKFKVNTVDRKVSGTSSKYDACKKYGGLCVPKNKCKKES